VGILEDQMGALEVDITYVRVLLVANVIHRR